MAYGVASNLGTFERSDFRTFSDYCLHTRKPCQRWTVRNMQEVERGTAALYVRHHRYSVSDRCMVSLKIAMTKTIQAHFKNKVHLGETLMLVF